MKLKVCGMKYMDNIQQVAELEPDYLGFIFYEKSKRNFEGKIPDVPKSIKKIGVFVNATIDEVVSKVDAYNLQAVQLHGDETVDYLNKLRDHFAQREKSYQENLKQVQIIKVFGIKDKFDFNILIPFIVVVDYFLFDTKGKERGGNGITFDWKVLENYPFSKPFFLSGGIGLPQVQELNKLKKLGLPIYAIDVNSQFESEPGIKKVAALTTFKEHIIKN